MLVPVTRAAATCSLGPVYLCDPKPTDPVVRGVLLYNTVLVTVLRASGDTRYWF